MILWTIPPGQKVGVYMATILPGFMPVEGTTLLFGKSNFQQIYCLKKKEDFTEVICYF